MLLFFQEPVDCGDPDIEFAGHHFDIVIMFPEHGLYDLNLILSQRQLLIHDLGERISRVKDYIFSFDGLVF